MYIDIAELKNRKSRLMEIQKSFQLEEPQHDGPLRLFHYTSLPTLFNLLETDTLWATATRFSNDSTEEMVLPTADYLRKNWLHMDNFLFCLSHKGDCLSQWRGYCRDGGAAVELDLVKPKTYSVLHADHDTSHLFETVVNTPMPVLYLNKEIRLRKTVFAELIDQDPPEAYHYFPYFKDAAFAEEGEWRLLFENTAHAFSKCVRFRTLRNGAKVPYLVVKCGDLGQKNSQCIFDESAYDSEEKLEKIQEKTNTILIPQGNNQEALYYRMKERIRAHNIKFANQEDKLLRLQCEGHLPVNRIILAPTYNRERLKEEVQRFCASIYWLEDVEIVSSQIPYIPPSE